MGDRIYFLKCLRELVSWSVGFFLHPVDRLSRSVIRDDDWLSKCCKIHCYRVSLIKGIVLVPVATGVHLFPFRTQQLSPSAPMVVGFRILRE